MVIGITGSSGAGKSTVCELLCKIYGIKIIISDEIAKELSKKGTKYLNEITRNFGEEILLENGELNRKKLASIIYHNEEKRNLLNNCTFKYICEEINRQITNANEKIVVIDAPLLFEAKLEKVCNVTIAVVSENKELQICRLIKRDGLSREEAISRINAQHPNDFYINKCDYTIINNEDIESLNSQIKTILEKLNC